MANHLIFIPLSLFAVMMLVSSSILATSCLIVSTVFIMIHQYKKKQKQTINISVLISGIILLILSILGRNDPLSELIVPISAYSFSLVFAGSLLFRKRLLAKLLFGSFLKLSNKEWQHFTWQWILFLLVFGSVYLVMSILSFISIDSWQAVRFVTISSTFLIYLGYLYAQYRKSLI